MNSKRLFDYNVSFSLAKSTVTQHDIFARLHKGSIHTITCSSCSCALSFPVHCPSPVIPVGFRFTHNSVYPSLPPLVLSGTFVFCRSIFTQAYYIFSTTRSFFLYFIFACRSLLYSSASICMFTINLYITALYWTRCHSFIGFRGGRSTVLLPNKKSGREVQPLAALYPTVRLSPWRQVRKNIQSRVWTPGHT